MTKTRSDDIGFRNEVLKQAVDGIKPPDFVTLAEEHMPFWKVITDARATWTDIDLVHAANLARTLYQIEVEQEALTLEGSVVQNQKGTQIANPRFSILEQLSRRSVALSAKIQVHAAATIGEVENNKNKNREKQKMLKTADKINEDDDLLAKPMVN